MAFSRDGTNRLSKPQAVVVATVCLLAVVSMHRMVVVAFSKPIQLQRARTSVSSPSGLSVIARLEETRSCPPPRFDDFSEPLIGKWSSSSSSTTTSSDNPLTVEVEEVMRSCGGAVQGIREPSLDSGSSSSIYLNRANDGFCFFRDGSYTQGPTSLTSDSKEPSLSCLVLPTVGRLVVSHDYDDDAVSEVRAAMRTKPKFGREDPSLFETTATTTTSTSLVQIDASDDDNFDLPITIERITRCRMPSPGQAWMMQRTKWESLLLCVVEETERKETTGGGDSLLSSSSVHYWTITESGRDFCNRIGIVDVVVDDISESTTTILHCGVVCPATKAVRIVARQYDDDDDDDSLKSLTGIMYLEGTVDA